MESKQEQIDEYAKITGQVVAKAWADEAFKARFLADPATVLREEGVPVPEYAELRAVESTDKVYYVVLPPPPSEDLSDEQLNQVAGGSTASTAGTIGSVSTLPCSTLGTAGSMGSVGTV